jgi:predicted nucleic acid-binding protein
MTTFVDTSAFYALVDRGEDYHTAALRHLESLKRHQADLVTSNYVVLETCALLQSRLGLEAVRTFQNEILQVVEIHWITEATHLASMAALLAARRRKLSLVDCTSFQIMRDLRIGNAFAFDRHFAEEGFSNRAG